MEDWFIQAVVVSEHFFGPVLIRGLSNTGDPIIADLLKHSLGSYGDYVEILTSGIGMHRCSYR